MSPGRLLQLLGLVIVTVVLVLSLRIADMTLEFGGLLAGMLVFGLGQLLESRRGGAGSG